MSTIRWGIIGCGNVTEVKSGPGFQKARNSDLVAVMRRDGALAADYARRHGVLRWYEDAGQLIHDPEVDAVYVATPPSSHREYVLACAAAGKPVYVEKPMGLNGPECDEMIAACRAAGVPLFVAYYRRALPRFLKVKELIETGAIGEIRTVTVALHQPVAPEDGDREHLPWRVVPEIAGGGKFVDVGCHTLDFLDYALGPIREAHGYASNLAGLYAAEDTVTAAFEFESGIVGSGTWCFASHLQADVAEITGSLGSVSFSSFTTDPIVLSTGQGVQAFDIPNPPHVQQPLIQAVVDALNGEGACPSTGETGARTTRAIDAILRDYRNAHHQGGIL